MVWWLKPWCAFMMAWVQTLMDVCINVSCTNVIYKHLHDVVNDKNTIYDSMIQKKKPKKNVVWLRGAHYSMSY